MTPEEKQLVRESWAKVVPIAPVAAELFYHRLFELDPSLRPLFTSDIAEQGRKLMKMLSLAVGSLDKLEELVPAVRALGKRRVAYGVKDEHYNTVATALLWTLEKGLGDDFTPEVRAAWGSTYTLLAMVMMEAAAEGGAA